jgi:hypothetical protein
MGGGETMHNILRLEMLRNDVSPGDISRCIDVSGDEFIRKISGKTDFTDAEKYSIKRKFFAEEDVDEIFANATDRFAEPGGGLLASYFPDAAALKGSGSDLLHLAQAQNAFYRGDYNACRQNAEMAVQLAAESGDSVVRTAGIFYLLRAYVWHGDIKKALQMVESLRSITEEAQGYQKKLCEHVRDVAIGWLYATANITDKIPKWILDNNRFTLPGETGLLFAPITYIRTRCHILKGDFYAAQSRLEAYASNHETELSVYAKIGYSYYHAIVYYYRNEHSRAIKWLKRAHSLAAPEGIILPFLEAGSIGRMLFVNAIYEKAPIPTEWLILTYSRLNTYAKRISNLRIALM